jgi:hypothetical protein
MIIERWGRTGQDRTGQEGTRLRSKILRLSSSEHKRTCPGLPSKRGVCSTGTGSLRYRTIQKRLTTHTDMPSAREEENPNCLDISPTRRGPEEKERGEGKRRKERYRERGMEEKGRSSEEVMKSTGARRDTTDGSQVNVYRIDK